MHAQGDRMANALALKLVIGASVSSTIGASFKLLEARIRQLRQLSSEGKGDLYPLGHETLGNGMLDSAPGDPPGARTQAKTGGVVQAAETQGSRHRLTLLKSIDGHLQVISFQVADVARRLSQSKPARVFVNIRSQAAPQAPAGAAAAASLETAAPASLPTDGTPAAGRVSDPLSRRMAGSDDTGPPAKGPQPIGIIAVASDFRAGPRKAGVLGGDAPKGARAPQRVFVVNAQDFCCGAITSRRGRGGRKNSPSRRRPSSAPVGRWESIKGYLGKAVPAIKAARAPAAVEAIYKFGKTFLTAETTEQKAEGYGGAVGGFGGALAGAALGAFVPVIGPAIGSVIGGIVFSEWGSSLAKKWFADDDAAKPPAGEPTHLSKSLGDVARSMNPGAGEPMTILSLPPAPPSISPAPQPIAQQITFAPNMPITVQGSVTDPAQLAMNIEPIIRRQFLELTRQASMRQLADPTFV